MTHFKDLHLSAKILATLEKKGYEKPTPIQEKSIPHVLEGKDLLGIAQTGTGKTAAFSLPIIDILSSGKGSTSKEGTPVRTLILTPTRELASQIADNVKVYSRGLGLSCAAIFGGVSINNQVRDMRRGFDIVVATPGRLIDLLDRRAVRLDKVEILVLDEADRMLDMGFIRDVKKIISKIPQKRQTLFFSATMPKTVSGLADSILDNPVKVEVTPQATTVEKIDQRVNFVTKDNKRSLLKAIIKQEEATSVLVFSKTKHGANRIGQFLYDEGIRAAAIHGNKSQAAREKSLKDFKLGKVKVLIATDIAARGIDVPEISHVVNYDIPHDPENYVHRIGRTARAGRNGIAISFCDSSEKILLRAIEKTIKYEIPVDKTHDFHDDRAAAPSKFSDRRGGGVRPQSRKISSSSSRSSSGGGAYGGDKKGRPKSRDSGSSQGGSYFGENRRRKDGFDDRKGTGKVSKFFKGDSGKPQSEGERQRGFAKKLGFSSGGRSSSGSYEDRRPSNDSRRSGDSRPRAGGSSSYKGSSSSGSSSDRRPSNDSRRSFGSKPSGRSSSAPRNNSGGNRSFMKRK